MILPCQPLVPIDLKPCKDKIRTFFDLAREEKMTTAFITTEMVTGRAAKNYVFDHPDKKDGEALALDYLNSDLNIIIGGGSKYFDKRYDGRNLFKEFKTKGYNTELKLSGLNRPTSGKTVEILEKEGIFRASARKDYLSKSALFAMQSLMGSGGSFIMIDDSKIEEADSLNNTAFLMEEMLDLDKMINSLTEQSGGQTLILVIGNFECGGLELKSTNISPKSDPDIIWHSKKATTAMAPVFAKGPGADQFSGFYAQEDIYKKVAALLKSRR